MSKPERQFWTGFIIACLVVAVLGDLLVLLMDAIK